ncbi:sulfurtransferase [Pseudorhodobacter turbinis]|uniref:Sulfurtransferase n=1 Tax=Pseudorhodobacter turbinis TaxID=2500533 RepID=A0A4V1E0K6_9RHOB|nr:rhodanese-like domain-containing protein [Pseudorhodobacter turbinis]QCO54964.1 sulfurtransferase [Pseudorhodobacter turbinis]
MQRIMLSSLTGLAMFCATTALAGDFGPLIMPADLAAGTVPEAVILDIRPKGFEAGHIAGAVSAPYGLFRGPKSNPGAVPPVADLERAYETLGLELDRPVVIVSQGDTDSDFGSAARVYWTLKSSGFTELAVLNGGATAWVNAGLPLSTQAATPVPTELAITWDNTWTADTAEVTAVVAGTEQATLVDSRPGSFFNGKKMHDAADRPGTLPGAMNLPHTDFFRPGATAINADPDLEALRAKLGGTSNTPVVAFCNTGHWAATDWFALSEVAGIDNVKLYAGSMVEYSQTDGEMANQPGLIAHLFNQLLGG